MRARTLFHRRSRIVAAVFVVTMLAGGCRALNASVPAPLREHAAPNGVPTATQTNVSPYPLLSRLGRWDGTIFAPVAAGSITSGNVVVLTHGWAAGLLPTYLAAQASSAPLVTMWNPAMVDPTTGEPAVALFAQLASAIAEAQPDAIILMFSWVDQSATDMSALAAYAPERATEVNGNRMASAIELSLAPGFTKAGGQLHLIGHSFGANVATTAAIALASSLPAPPRQLTLFDSPEVELARIGGAKNDLRYKLPRLDIGRTEWTTFVDNYISLVGEPYSAYPGLDQVVDVRLAPPSSAGGAEKHLFPLTWYAASGIDRSSGVGVWWSPLLGADVVPLSSSWRQTSADPTRQLQLEAIGPIPEASPRRTLSSTTQALEPGTIDANATTPVANATITTDDDSLWLDFTASFIGAPTDTLHLFIDGRERWTMVPTNAVDGRPSRFVILYDLEAGDHTLSLTVEGAAEGSPPSSVASARLSQMSIASTTGIERNLSPEQTTRLIWWILALVILAIVIVVVLLVLLLVRLVRRVRHRGSLARGGR